MQLRSCTVAQQHAQQTVQLAALTRDVANLANAAELPVRAGVPAAARSHGKMALGTVSCSDEDAAARARAILHGHTYVRQR